jgi:hypothetical protein
MCWLTQTRMLLKGADPDLGGRRGDTGEQERVRRRASRTRAKDFLPLRTGINIGESSTQRARKPGLCESYFEYPISDVLDAWFPCKSPNLAQRFHLPSLLEMP